MDSFNKKFEKRTYYDRYGIDVIISFIIVFIVFLIVSYFHILNNIQPIKKDWDNQRCNPRVIPFAGIINRDSNTSVFEYTDINFSFCLNKYLGEIIHIFFKPIEIINNSITSFIESIMNNFNYLIVFLEEIKTMIEEIFEEIYIVLMNIIIEFINLFIKIDDSINKVIGILTTIIYTIINSFNFILSFMGIVHNIAVLYSNTFVIAAQINLILIIIWWPAVWTPVGGPIVFTNIVLFLFNLIMYILFCVFGWGFMNGPLQNAGVTDIYFAMKFPNNNTKKKRNNKNKNKKKKK